MTLNFIASPSACQKSNGMVHLMLRTFISGCCLFFCQSILTFFQLKKAESETASSKEVTLKFKKGPALLGIPQASWTMTSS